MGNGNQYIRYHVTTIGMAIIKKHKTPKITRVGKEVEKTEFLCIYDGNVELLPLENSIAALQKS